MKNTFTVEVTHGIQMYTAYEGKSRDKAADIAAAVVRAVAISSGEAEVTLRVGTVADVVWSIKDGSVFLSLIGGASAAAAKR